MSRFLSRILEAAVKRGIFFGLLLMGYLALAQPAVLRRMAWAVDRGVPDWPLGLALAGALIFEPVGLALTGTAVRRSPGSENTLLPFGIWMAHLLVSTLMALTAFSAMGVDFTVETTGLPWPAAALLVLNVLKELGYLMFFVLEGPADQPGPAGRPFRSLAGRLMVFPFSALGFTSSWDFIALRTPLNWSDAGDWIIGLAGLTLVFLMAYGGAGGVPLAETLAAPRTRRDNLMLGGIALASYLLAMSIIPAK